MLADGQVIMVHMKNVQREDLLKQLTRKMAPPLGKSLFYFTVLLNIARYGAYPPGPLSLPGGARMDPA